MTSRMRLRGSSADAGWNTHWKMAIVVPQGRSKERHCYSGQMNYVQNTSQRIRAQGNERENVACCLTSDQGHSKHESSEKEAPRRGHG